MNRDWTSSDERFREADDYEGFVRMIPEATVFHSRKWLQVVDVITPGGVSILRIVQGAETIAVLPHVHLRRGPFRLILSPPPAAGMQYLGPLILGWTGMKQGKRERRLAMVAEALLAHMRETHSDYCQIRWPPGMEDARAFQWNGFEVLPRYVYVLPLSDEQTVWDSLGANVRSSIRRNSAGIVLTVGDDTDWPVFERRLAERYADQGLSRPLPNGYLEALRNSLGDALKLLVARREGAWLGAAALIRFQDRTILWQGAVKGLAGPSVNDVLVWEAIRNACLSGSRKFELMGANTQRIAEFKAKFNPRLESYLETQKSTLLASAARRLRSLVRSGGW